jgi:hypothetical protein
MDDGPEATIPPNLIRVSSDQPCEYCVWKASLIAKERLFHKENSGPSGSLDDIF